MAKRIQILRRGTMLAAGTFLLSTVGCAFPNSGNGGDPLLGNFNRPIVPTPPPERGGLGLDSPAYDSGSRIGMLAPDIATPTDPATGLPSLPPAGNAGALSGLRMPFGSPSDLPSGRRQGVVGGARLPNAYDSAPRITPTSSQSSRYSTDGPSFRGKDPLIAVTSASAITPVEPDPVIKLASHEVKRDPSKVEKMEEGFEMLQAAGARGLRTEQLGSNEWLFACTVGAKVHEARGQNQLEAMKKVLDQMNAKR